MKSLAYEGLTVEFHDCQRASVPTDVPTDVPTAMPSLPDDEYLVARKNDTAVPSALPEVVNLARDYDRWDQYGAPPHTEGDQ